MALLLVGGRRPGPGVATARRLRRVPDEAELSAGPRLAGPGGPEDRLDAEVRCDRQGQEVRLLGVAGLVPSTRHSTQVRSDREARQHRDRRAIHPLDEARVRSARPCSTAARRDAARTRLLRELVQRAPPARGAGRPDTARGVRGPAAGQRGRPVRAPGSVATEGAMRRPVRAVEGTTRRQTATGRPSAGRPTLATRAPASSSRVTSRASRNTRHGRRQARGTYAAVHEAARKSATNRRSRRPESPWTTTPP